MSDTKTASNGIGFGTILFLLFLTLKLCGVITWSWWWVTCPLWAPVAVILLILVGIAITGVIVAMFGS